MDQFAGCNLWRNAAEIAGNADAYLAISKFAIANDSHEKIFDASSRNFGNQIVYPNFFQLMQTRDQSSFAVEPAIDWRFMIFNLYRRGRARLNGPFATFASTGEM